MADMLYLVRAMSVAGVSDCWDGVDRWTRNMLAEAQLLETDWAYDYAARHGTEVHHEYAVRESVPERCRGAWGGCIAASDWQGHPVISIPACCAGNAARQLYIVWRDMISLDERAHRLTVHLLMNRASPWADINSYIPCRGQVDVSLKRPCEVALRIPEWAAPEDCVCTINGIDVAPRWERRYAVVRANRGDEVGLQFPITERQQTLHIAGSDHRVIVRGTDIVDISPPGVHHPVFQRPHLRNDQPSRRKCERFVADEVLRSS